MKCASRGRKTWRACVKEDTVKLGLDPEWAVFRVQGYVERPHIGENV